ncbi:transporter substrate-binding domain-containing protein [Acuticoccus sp. MNP-M23]|uniref:transporter substrate-binding domain-containing protein n=1 Tax=Acuticoccus sp. MNP-M23 TaxID=3072793 RepID=UPI0028149A65|nr:transporter substrate-binding domain-containing protein [Acuticoccus sp. MNP-M23]WMS43240.1 transporter substrate-binding domain-containing protein [Acuticoccus sp. MNP-M23]
MAANPSLTIGVVADNEPYSFFRNGQIMGWTIDVIRRIEARSGLEIDIRLGAWPEVYGRFRSGDLDIIADISKTPERSSFIDFTDAYHLRRTVLFHNIDNPLDQLDDLGALATKRIGIIKDIYYADVLTEAGIEPIPYDTYRELMAALAFGWIDTALAPKLTGNFFARENGFTNIDVAGSLPVASISLEDFRFATIRTPSGDPALLHSILQKALSAIPTEELAAITERWLSYRDGRAAVVQPLRLLPEEQGFIANAPLLSIGFISDYEPFSFLEDGRGQGLAVQLAHELSARTGLTMKPVFDNWSNLLTAFQNGEIDIISNISFTEEREEYTLFSQEYHRIPNAVFVRSGFGPYRGIQSLAGKLVGIGKDIYYADALTARLGDVVSFNTQEQILAALSAGEIDAAIMALSNGNAIIRRMGLINIEIGGEFLMEGVERENLRFGVSPKYPFVKSILDRAMNAMPLSSWNELERRWLGPAIAGIVAPRANLTTAEREYLRNKSVIKVCFDPLVPPYSAVDEDGAFIGVSADIMARLAETGGFSWQVQPVRLFGENYVPDESAECDILPFTSDRGTDNVDWDTTDPYMVLPMAVATPLQTPFVESLHAFDGRRVGYVPERSPTELLQRRYPNVTLIPIEDEAEGIHRVRDGTLDAMLGTLGSFGFLISEMEASDVKIAGRIAEDWRAAMATRADEPMLGAVINKLLANLDDNEVSGILNRQMLVRIEQSVNYTRMIQLGVAATFVVALFVFWNRQLYRLNSALNEANRKLQEVSIRDGLTGVFNRMHFDERANEAFMLARRNGWLFSIAMLDVDHFKAINDKFGHPFGDLCLQQIAVTITRYFSRGGDHVARYGGEEFVIFEMGGSASDFRMRLETMREAIASTPSGRVGETISITLSAGCFSGVPEISQTLADFVRLADLALYEAKGNGRNAVVAHGLSDGSRADADTMMAPRGGTA